MTADRRRFSPATARNRDLILGVLKPHLPPSGLVVEVASGSGEHITHFAQAAPKLSFQPTDPDEAARASIDAWTRSLGLSNVLPALALDAAEEKWPVERLDVLLCINMVHISPWHATVGLMAGAARVLPVDGLLYLYGPYRREGKHTSPSNAQFDAELREQNPLWGVRDVEAVIELAAAHGIGCNELIEMPANNLSLIFRKRCA